ncbi:hypothetical protein ABK040_010366 [Willaertia magna]
MFKKTKVLFKKTTLMNQQQDNSIKYGGMANKSWEGLWQVKKTPWDAGKGVPILKHLVDTIYNKEEYNFIKNVLVPGAGSGYDCEILSTLKHVNKVIGLDISQSAIDHAIKLKEKYTIGNVSKVDFICQDFFGVKEKFDLIFDYTFLCALPIQLRRDWASKMKDLLNKNERSELITLIFPLVKKNEETGEMNDMDRTKGPPYILDFELVNDLLTNEGFENIEHYKVPENLSHPQRANNEILARWILK